MKDPRGPLRTVKSATYTPSAERTDDAKHDYGDVTYVTFEECDHVGLKNPTMTFKVGSRVRCFACGREGK